MKPLDANTLLEDSWRLAAAVCASGWRPDAILAIWRGGAYIAIAMHEFFKAKGRPCALHPVECKSYTAPGKSSEPRWNDCTGALASLRAGMKVLAVDDICDSGRTLASLRRIALAAGAELKSAVIYRNAANASPAASPDWHLYDTDGEWLAFPHELEGLPDELLAARCPELLAEREKEIVRSSPSPA